MAVHARDEVILVERRDKIVVTMAGNVLFICDTWQEAETIAMYLEMMTWMTEAVGVASRALRRLRSDRALSFDGSLPIAAGSGGEAEPARLDVPNGRLGLVEATGEVLEGLVHAPDGGAQVENRADQGDQATSE